MTPQTIPQILRCLTLGSYTATVEDGRLEIQGPQPLAGPLPASIEARRAELITYLSDHCDGVWPPAPGSRESVRAEQLRQAHKRRREERAREFLARSRARRVGTHHEPPSCGAPDSQASEAAEEGRAA